MPELTLARFEFLDGEFFDISDFHGAVTWLRGDER
jgi:hypothetical protein